MRADFKVVLDACVLGNYSVCDLYLRLAESPRLYLPKWSSELLDETARTHGRLGWPPELIKSFQKAVRCAFPEAMTANYEHLIEHCLNDPKDRHVLACAAHCQAEVIVTFNLRDFPAEALKTWGVQAMHPEDYLLSLYSMDRLIVYQKLAMIADKRRCSVADHLIDLGQFLPGFAQRVLADLQ